MAGRLAMLGLPTGTRGGRLEGLTWEPNSQHGHIDLETGSHPAHGRAQASAGGAAAPTCSAEIHRWKAE
jgi:hypothetical protein